jgi:excisionase family DNA binding protein
MEPLLTVRECARLMGASEDFVRDRITSGELRALRRIGRGYRVRAEDLDAFLALRARPEQPTSSARAPTLPPSPLRPPRRGRRPCPAGAATVFTSSAAAHRALFGKGEP